MSTDDTHDDARGTGPGSGPNPGPGDGERIAKVLSRAGVASRRDCERLILEGRVFLNGERVDSPAVNVRPQDRLSVDGRRVEEAEATRLWLFHKPAGLVTTERDEEGRETVFDALPEDMPRVMSVGRLDITSEGLLILTNDGEAKRRLELPSTGWLRRYRVRINGALSEQSLDELRAGVTVDGVEYQPMEVEFDRQQGANAWLTVGLREGKNREVRRVMEHLGVQVNRLIRVSYGPFQLGNLEPGAVEEVRSKVVRDQLGLDAPKPQRTRRKAGGDLGPVAVERPERAALGTSLPAGAVKRSLKARAPKVRGEEPGPRRAETRPGAPKPMPASPLGGRKARTYLRKDGPRPATAELEEEARQAARAAREAAKAGGGGRDGERPAMARQSPGREGGERPRSAGFKSHARPEGAGSERPRSQGFKSHGKGEDRPRPGGFRREGGPERPGPRGEAGQERPRAARPPRRDDDARPPRAVARPERAPRPEGGERPARPGRPARFERPEGNRPARTGGPRGPGAPRGDRPERAPRHGAGGAPDRPRREEGGPRGPDRAPRGDKPRFDRPQSGRPQSDRPQSDRSRSERSGPGGPRAGDARQGDRPRGGPGAGKPRDGGPRPYASRGPGAPGGRSGPGGPRKGPPKGGAPGGRKPRGG